MVEMTRYGMTPPSTENMVILRHVARRHAEASSSPRTLDRTVRAVAGSILPWREYGATTLRTQ